MEVFSRCGWLVQSKYIVKSMASRIVKMSQSDRSLSANTASVCKIHRKVYERMYPTVVVLPDGASINIRYHEPRKIIKLPLDLSTLSEKEKKLRLERRKPKRKAKVIEDIDDNFDAKQYLNLMKRL